MDRRRQLHVEALLKWLHPAQRHADTRIRLAAREQLQQLILAPAKLIFSTLRLRLAKNPRSSATATPTLQTALVFQVIFSSRGTEPGATAVLRPPRDR